MLIKLCIIGLQAHKICALKGSSVSLSCSADHTKWYTINIDQYVLNNFSGDGFHTRYNISGENKFTLTIHSLRESDAAFYCCGTVNEDLGRCWLLKTELQVAGKGAASYLLILQFSTEYMNS